MQPEHGRTLTGAHTSSSDSSFPAGVGNTLGTALATIASSAASPILRKGIFPCTSRSILHPSGETNQGGVLAIQTKLYPICITLLPINRTQGVSGSTYGEAGPLRMLLSAAMAESVEIQPLAVLKMFSEWQNLLLHLES